MTLILAASFGVSLFQSLPGKTDDGGYGEHGNRRFYCHCASGDGHAAVCVAHRRSLCCRVSIAHSSSLVLEDEEKENI